MKRITCLMMLALALLTVTAVLADTTVRSRSRMVYVNVQVRDSNGRPVTGLTREDFTLSDEGTPQEIQFFKAPGEKALQVPSGAEAATPQPGGFTNRAKTDATPRMAILLDLVNTPIKQQMYALDQLKQFLEQKGAEANIAVYVLGPDLSVVQEFTGDTGKLRQSVAKLKPWRNRMEALDNMYELRQLVRMTNAGLPAGQQGASMAGINSSVGSEMEGIQMEQRLRTLQTLTSVAQHLSGLSGQKNVIWLTGGLPFVTDSQGIMVAMDGGAAWRDTLQSLSSANVAVSTILTNGVCSLNDPSIDTAQILAAKTGGLALYHTNDLRSALQQASDAPVATYELAFAPAHNAWDGSFRKIGVQLNRSGLVVHHRQGYVAEKDEALPEIERIIAMGKAALAPVDYTAIALTVHPQSLKSQGGRLPLKVELNPLQLEFQNGPDGSAAQVDLLFVARGHGRKPLSAFQQNAEIALPPGISPVQANNFCQVEGEYDLPAGAKVLKVVVRDRLTGRMGSVDIDLTPAMKD